MKKSQQKIWYSAVGVLMAICFVVVGLLNINVANAQYGGGGGGSYWQDYTAPTISNINVTVSGTTATITWTTDEASISWVVYGIGTAYGSEVKTTTYLTSHSVTLSGLSSATTYHYSVKSKDSTGNIGSYTDKTFTTQASTLTPTPTPIVGPVIIPTLPANPTNADYQNLLNALIKQLAYLQGLLTAQQGGAIGYHFTVTLAFGDTGEDVRQLQIFLKAQGTEIYPEGLVTGYFGSLTQKAVERFQVKYNIVLSGTPETTGYGLVGPLTRAKINALQGL